MTEKPMAPNCALSGGNQPQTVATPSVEHGAELRGMTDEERARALVRRYGQSDKLFHDFMKHAAAIRADERENCAQEIEPPNAGAGDSEVDDALYRAAETIRARGSE